MGWLRSAGLAAALLTLAGSASAGMLDRMAGHLSFGYAKLFVGDAPGGSLSLAAGADYPVWGPLSFGVDVGYHLLGSRTVERGSLLASVDYSAFEAAALLHWAPAGLGPLARVSAGPGVMAARGELSTAGGGAAFVDLAVHEAAPMLAADLTFMSKRPSAVRVGLELGTRIGYLEHETWTLGTARVAVHY